ncbi:MAG: glycoside hydrolase family 3 N-terminal domain-containing protein [Angustibacter sp.]
MVSSQEVPALASRVLLASFAGRVAPEWLLARLADGLGGVCLYGDNVRDLEQVRRALGAVHDARPQAITTLDEEGGDVTRLHYLTGSPHAGAAVLGAADDERVTSRVAGDIATQLLAQGVDLDLGPVADVNSNPANPVIGVRSFGADPEACARHVRAWVRGLQAAGAGACLKHFPGHGDTATDSHLDLPVVDQQLDVLRRRELVPFAAGIAAGAVAVMTSHVVVRALDPAAPATFSPAATRLLRGELGFDGLLVSDALDMRGASAGRGVPAAAVLALLAGVDLLCLGPGLDDGAVAAVVAAVTDAVADGTLPVERLREAAARVDAASARLAALRASAVPAPDARASSDAATLALTVTGPVPVSTAAQVLRLDGGSNQAVGGVPWGLPADGRVLAGAEPVDVHEGDDPLARLDGRPVVVLTRDAGRHAWARDVLARLAQRRPDAVVVEMGWPSEDALAEGLTTVRTWGASQVSAQALDQLLAEGR